MKKCPYEIQREVNRFVWSMEDYAQIKVVSFRLNIDDKGLCGDIVAKIESGKLKDSFLHYKLTSNVDTNNVLAKCDTDENGRIKIYSTMSEAMKPYGLKRGYNSFC